MADLYALGLEIKTSGFKDASGADPAAIARLNVTVDNMKRDLPAIVTQSIRKANQSNVKFG